MDWLRQLLVLPCSGCGTALPKALKIPKKRGPNRGQVSVIRYEEKCPKCARGTIVTVTSDGFVGTQPARLFTGQSSNGTFAVVEEAIRALLDARDFLGYQLSHANGNMTDAELDEIADEYLHPPVKRIPGDLRERIRVLKAVLGYSADRLDSEAISLIFRCTLDDAMTALRELKT
jgi:hypothetical protein